MYKCVPIKMYNTIKQYSCENIKKQNEKENFFEKESFFPKYNNIESG